MKDYDAMSDFEISCLVAEVIYGIDKSEMKELVYANKKSAPVWENSWDGLKSFNIDNPADMMPIVFENRICVEPDPFSDTVWNAVFTNENETIHVTNKNPLRAAAICFLKMKDAENVQ